MKQDYQQHLVRPNLTRPLVSALAAALLLLGLSVSSMAQRSSAPPPPPPQDLTMRENRVAAMEEAKEKAKAKRDPRAVMEQVNEDFSRIQDINNDLLKAVSSGKTLDFQLIAQAAEEIRMRSARLKENLTLPGKSKKPEKLEVGSDETQIKTALTALNELMQSFVTNPIFKSTGVDAEQGAKARHDLEGIIDLSERIKKAAEKMKK